MTIIVVIIVSRGFRKQHKCDIFVQNYHPAVLKITAKNKVTSGGNRTRN